MQNKNNESVSAIISQKYGYSLVTWFTLLFIIGFYTVIHH